MIWIAIELLVAFSDLLDLLLFVRRQFRSYAASEVWIPRRGWWPTSRRLRSYTPRGSANRPQNT
jgi:hypothetical protein